MFKMLTSAICYYFLFYLVKTAHSTLNSCKTTFDKTACCNVTDPAFGENVYLAYYNCTDNKTTNYNMANITKLVEVLKNSIKSIKIVIHGFFQKENNPKIRDLAYVVCENGKNHVIILDWGKYAFNINYFQVAKKAFEVGALFNQYLLECEKEGLDLSKLHIIGFSLGAHIAGFAIGCNDLNIIPRTTGLDPANPILYPARCYFNPSNQTGVEIVHTNMGQFGSCCSMGEQEWFVNSGRWQPNCPNIDIPNTIKDVLNFNSNTSDLFNSIFGLGLNNTLPYFFCHHGAALDYYTHPERYEISSEGCTSNKCPDGKKNTAVFGYKTNPENTPGQYCVKIISKSSTDIISNITNTIIGTGTKPICLISSCPVQSYPTNNLLCTCNSILAGQLGGL